MNLSAANSGWAGLRSLALLLFALCVVADVIAAGLTLTDELTDDAAVALACIPAAAFGALVALKQRRNPIGWILLAVALFFSLQLVSGSFLEAHSDEPESTGVIVAAWFAAWAWIPAITLGGAFLPLLFPNGRASSRRWQWVAWIAAAGILIGLVSVIFKPGALDSDVPAQNPIGIEGTADLFVATEALSGALIVSAFGAAVLSQILRFRGAEGDEREQLKWFAYIGCFVVVGMLLAFLSTLVHTEATQLAGDIGWYLGALSLGVGLPVAVGIAILRYRLYDIDWIISRTLVYIPLTALLAGVYIALTGVFRTVLSDSTGGNSDAAVAFTTVVVVAMLTPAKNYLQETVDRHFKEGRDPAKKLEALGKEARTAAELLDRSLFLQRFLESAVEALEASGGSISLDGPLQRRFECEDCHLTAAITLEIQHETQTLGVLEVSQRRSGRPYRPSEVDTLRQSLGSVAYLVSLEVEQRRARI